MLHILRSTLEKNLYSKDIVNTALDSKIIREIDNYKTIFIQIHIRQILRL